MKSSLLALCLILLLVACSTPPPETSTVPPPSENSSTPPPISSSFSPPHRDYFVEERESGFEDREAVDALYCYLYENLTPAQYNTISLSFGQQDGTYFVHVAAPNKASIEELLNVYSGPWAPVYYETCRFSEAERKRAQLDLRRFLKADQEMERAVSEVFKVEFMDCIEVYVKSRPDKLVAFFENYPNKDIFCVEDWVDPDTLNPD